MIKQVMKYLIIVLVLFFTHGCYLSQKIDSIKKLRTFEKSTSRFLLNDDFLKSDKNLILEDERSSESISSIIEGETTNYIKSYSPGNLSSISIRGGNSQQTSLVYNDFLLNNPLNGIVDLSMIPSVFFNSINLIYGLPSSSWGNGGLSGAICLEGNNKNTSSLEAGSSYGSFQQKTNYIKLNLKGNNISTSLKFFRQKAENNFRYLDFNDEFKRQENSSTNQIACMIDSKIQLSKIAVDITYLGQLLERKVPKTILESMSNAVQNDENHRIFVSFKQTFKNYFLQLKTAFYREFNTYNDSLRLINSANPCNTLLNQLIFSKTYNDFNHLKINLTNLIAKTNGNNYLDKIQVNRLSLTSSYKIKKSDTSWNHLFNSRVLLDENYLSPLTFSYSLNKKIFKRSDLYLNFGKVYRFPAINDLYWNPGGNLNLKPESGWSSDIGIIWKYSKNNIKLSFEPTVYSRWINNWILWQPGDNFWSPMNVKSVWNRGLETSVKLFHQLEKGDILLTAKTAYNISTNTDSYNNNNDILNKQLIYAPHYKFIFKFKYTNKKISLTYLHNYTGYRYTSNDNNHYLPAFHLGNIYVTYNVQLNKNTAKIFYKINNVYNINYQLITNRPMPMVNNEIGFNLKLNK